MKWERLRPSRLKITFCCLSIQSSGSCGFQEQQRILGLFELSQEFKQQHYLTGLLLTELSAALDVESEAYVETQILMLFPPLRLQLTKIIIL